MKVAYLINQYPKVSHSFIRREIQALERLGFQILRYSIRGSEGRELVDPEDLREHERTRFVLRDGAVALALCVLSTACRGPGRFFAALALSLRMGIKADRSLPYHLAYLAEACWISSRLRESEVKHLHAHFGTNSAEVAMLAHILSGVPYSFTVHGPDEFDKPEFIGLREKTCHAAFVVTVSSFGRSQLLRWIDLQDWQKVKVVHCGVDFSFLDEAEHDVPARPRLVCVGRLSAQKGQLLLLEAAAHLKRNGVRFELVLAGDGELRTQIEEAIARNRLGDQVRITGWLTSDQVRQEMLAARALVVPSFAEGLPVVIMEAMGLRRPVLATHVAGIPELVIDGQSGWLFPAGSIEELAAAMTECLGASTGDLAQMGRSARQRVLARHDADTEASKLAELFLSSLRMADMSLVAGESGSWNKAT